MKKILNQLIVLSIIMLIAYLPITLLFKVETKQYVIICCCMCFLHSIGTYLDKTE